MRRLPELFDLRVKARSLAYLYAAGAVLGLLTLALPHDQAVRDVPLIVLAGVALAAAGLLLLVASRIREWQLHLMVAAGTLIITLANYYVGRSALYPLFYSWTTLYAFYFFTTRIALVHLAFVGALLRGAARRPGRDEPGGQLAACGGNAGAHRAAALSAARTG